MSAPRPTWDEFRARSEQQLGGLTVFCGDCAMVHPHSGLPCRRHATPEESLEIDAHLREVLSRRPAPLFVRDPDRAAKLPPRYRP